MKICDAYNLERKINKKTKLLNITYGIQIIVTEMEIA